MILAGHDATVAKWVSEKLGCSFHNVVLAPGVIDDTGLLIGGAVLSDHSRFDVELTYYGPGTVSIRLARLLAKFVFEDLGCERCTMRVPRTNKAMLRGAPKIGFQHEGLARRLYGPGKKNDAVLFGLLREDAGRLLRKPTHVNA